MGEAIFTAYFKRQTIAQGSSTVAYEVGNGFPEQLLWEGATYWLLATDKADNSATYEFYAQASQAVSEALSAS